MKTHLIVSILLTVLSLSAFADKEKTKALKVGADAPEFKITDTNGKEIDLAELTKEGPVLVRLTCGCLGCDLELPYFQALQDAYKEKGLTSLAIFAEPDEKFAAYAEKNNLKMLYALDPKKETWKVFGTKTMPSNFLIDKGGKLVAISKGCNPEGLKALALGTEAAKLVSVPEVDFAKNVSPRPNPKKAKKADKE
jgi:peroxiredoxin